MLSGQSLRGVWLDRPCTDEKKSDKTKCQKARDMGVRASVRIKCLKNSESDHEILEKMYFSMQEKSDKWG